MKYDEKVSEENKRERDDDVNTSLAVVRLGSDCERRGNGEPPGHNKGDYARRISSSLGAWLECRSHGTRGKNYPAIVRFRGISRGENRKLRRAKEKRIQRGARSLSPLKIIAAESSQSSRSEMTSIMIFFAFRSRAVPLRLARLIPRCACDNSREGHVCSQPRVNDIPTAKYSVPQCSSDRDEDNNVAVGDGGGTVSRQSRGALA